MFVAPTEPVKLKDIGVVSSTPEDYGVDVLWQSKLGLVGVQRKEFPNDFLASVHDGRLNREYAMMKSLDVAILMVEGKGSWTSEGSLIRPFNGKRHPWNKATHHNYLASVQLRGVQVHTTDNLDDSIRFLEGLERWSNKDGHTGLDSRPAAMTTPWASVENVDYQRYLYQSLPGINIVRATALQEHLGMIFSLRVSEEDLMTVPGIGKGLAKKIVGVFRG